MGRERLKLGSVPRRDVVPLKGVHDGVELDAELDVAVANVFWGCLCAAPAMEGCLERFHVPDEIVYDGRDVWSSVLFERSWTSRCHLDVNNATSELIMNVFNKGSTGQRAVRDKDRNHRTAPKWHCRIAHV